MPDARSKMQVPDCGSRRPACDGRPTRPALSPAPAFWDAVGRSSQRRISSAVARRRTKRLRPRCSRERRPPSLVENRDRGVLPERCQARHCARGYREPRGRPGTITYLARATGEAFIGSLIGLVAATEMARKASPVGRASSDIVPEGTSPTKRVGEQCWGWQPSRSAMGAAARCDLEVVAPRSKAKRSDELGVAQKRRRTGTRHRRCFHWFSDRPRGRRGRDT